VLSDDPAGDVVLIIAGVTPLSPSSRHPLATLRPRPDVLWGFVETSTDLSPALRMPIVSGHTGPPLAFDPVEALMPDLPVVDTDILARHFSTATLYLMTNRGRLVETSLYSNNREISIMFRVTDRFLVPDSTTTRISCTIRDPFRSLPLLLPGARINPEDGSQVVLAVPVADGWYAVQYHDTPVPSVDIGLEISVETPLSLKPWTLPNIPASFPIGRILYSCPRSATDRAIFAATFQVRLARPPTPQLIQRVGCRLHVVARRIIFSPARAPPGSNYTMSVLVESFNRLRQVREAFSDPSWFLALADDGRPATPMDSIREWSQKRRGTLVVRQDSTTIAMVMPDSLVYVNDTADSDATMSCPPGKYFSTNGTYEPLPQHALSGPDCYGLVCIDGYDLLYGQQAGWPPSCIPAPLPDEVIWVCVIVILSLVAFVVSILCCVRLARAVQPAPLVPLPAPPPASDPSVQPPPHDWGIMPLSGVHLDDYSSMILEGEFSPIARGESDRHCRVF
jgi:hypothetical protein